MRVFWRKGYASTSMPQLLEAMQLSRSSLYSTFGGKRQLFVEAFALYNAYYRKLVEKVAASDDPIAAILLYFSNVVTDMRGHRLIDGCMVVNTLLELADVDADLSQMAVEQLNLVEKAFTQCFENAMAVGTFTSNLSPRQLAQIVLTFNQGVRVASKKGADREQLKESIYSYIALLDPTFDPADIPEMGDRAGV